MTILIADDNEKNRYQLEVLLGGNGYQVVTAAHGAEALAKARQHPPDLIVSDILMPVMDGFALCREWKQDARLRAIPFIFYTATYTDERDREFGLSLGAARFLVKPEDSEAFLRMIREVILQVATAPPGPPPPATDTPARLPIAAPQEEETVYLKQYNEALVRRLEHKMEQVEQANRELERDITVLRLGEEKLRLMVERFDLATRAARLGVWDWEVPKNQLVWSGRMYELYGLNKGSFPGAYEAWRQGLHPEDRIRGDEEVQQALRGEKALDSEFRVVWPDGAVRHIKAYAQVVRDADGHPLRMIGINYDITDRKREELEIQSQAALLDLAQNSIAVRDMNGSVQYWNKSCERLMGWNAAEALGRPIAELVKPDPAFLDCAMRVLLEEGYWGGELQLTAKDGRLVTVMSRWTLVRDEQGQPKSVLDISTDLTEQKKLEAQFLRAQRLEAVGILAIGIAHDLNNILAPILMAAPMLRDAPTPTEMAATLDLIESSAQRAADVIRQLLTFGRGRSGERITLHLQHLLRDLHNVIHETFPKNIRFTSAEAPDLWPLLADPTQFQQVLLNLCINARDAMPEGGTLTLTAANFQADDHYARMVAGARPGAYIHLQVSDTGNGIRPEDLDKIFDPFFTTKEVGHGTGLGLATVHRVVTGHGGFVQVRSQVGRGTTFDVYLPASPEAEAVASVEPAVPTSALAGRGELILVVDDEEGICQIMQQTLVRHGYRAVTASDGAEAVAVFAQRQAEVKAVITDLMMPMMDGLDLVSVLTKITPGLPVVVSTGLGSDPAQDQKLAALRRLGVGAILTKPYPADQLLRALQAVLSPPGPKPNEGL